MQFLDFCQGVIPAGALTLLTSLTFPDKDAQTNFPKRVFSQYNIN